MTPFEAQLWARLSRSQLGGYKFRRQHVIGKCIVDFFCPQKGLIESVLELLLSTLNELPNRWPHPDPSPEGEGKS